MAEVQIKSMRDWHVELINFDLMHPSANLRMKAAYFGVSMSWLSVVQNSDAYREYRAKRRDEHFENVSFTVVDKLQALADMSIDEMNGRIEKDKDIPLSQLREIGDMALKNLGFGSRSNSAPVQINNNVIVADREALANAREKMKLTQERVSQLKIEKHNNSESSNGSANSFEGEILPPAK